MCQMSALWATVTPMTTKRRPRVRANGEGSVFRLTDGRWRATKTAGFTAEGKQKFVTGSGPTREIAIQRRDAAWKKFLVASGQAPQEILRDEHVTKPLTVGEWLYQWHASLDLTRTTELYRRQVLSRIELHLSPTLGKTAIRLLTHHDIERLIRETLPAKRKENGQPVLSEASIVNIYRTLSLCLDEAVKAGHIPANPANRVTPPKKKRARVEIERKKWIPLHLMKNLEGDPMEAFYLIKMLYGVRMSELLGMTDDSLYLTSRNPRLVISTQLMRRDVRHGCGPRKADGSFNCGKKSSATCPKKEGVSGWYLAPPKSEAGVRTLPLVEPALSAIKEHMKRQKALRESPDFEPLPGLEKLIWTTPTGKPITPNMATKSWTELLEENKVDYVRGHEMRHITATLLAESGVTLEVVKRILGHSEAAMSAYYTHVGEKATREPLESLAAHITKRQERGKAMKKAKKEVATKK